MSTEARIGVVAGLLIVVVASVYVFYTGAGSKDDTVASVTPTAEPKPTIPPTSDAKTLPNTPPAGKPQPAAPRPGAPAVAKPPIPSPATPGTNTAAAKPTVPSPTQKPESANPVAKAAPPAGGPTTRPAQLASASHTPASPSAIQGPPAPTPAVADPKINANKPAAPATPAVAASSTDKAGSPSSVTPSAGTTPDKKSDATSPSNSQTAANAEKPASPGPTTTAPSTIVANRPFPPTPLRSDPSANLVDATKDNLKKAIESEADKKADAEKKADSDKKTDKEDATSSNKKPPQGERPLPNSPRADNTVGSGTPAKLVGNNTPPAKTGGNSLTKTPETPATPSTPAETWPKEHKVESGDSLSSIADKYYGSSGQSKIAALLKANPQLKNPRTIKIGETIKVPALDKPVAETKTEASKTAPGNTTGASAKTTGVAAKTTDEKTTVAKAEAKTETKTETTSSDAGKSYVVREGETFYSIAKAKLGNAGRWEELFQLNKDLVKGDPKRLKPNMTIKLP